MEKLVLTEEEIYRGSLILVTPDFPLREAIERSDMKSVLGAGFTQAKMPDILLRQQAVRALQALLSDIGCKEEITAVSGFRTQKEQEEIWEDSMAENGEDFTRKFVAVPGHSEHQSGYAIDLGENVQDIDFICPRFPHQGIFGKFRERMAYFGFVERYMAGKEEITGIGAEPWHFRYVGYPHSVIMAERNMVLEEYIEFLHTTTEWGKPYIFRDNEAWAEISCISLENGGKETLEVPKEALYQISGTNEGGVVVTLWRKNDEK